MNDLQKHDSIRAPADNCSQAQAIVHDAEHFHNHAMLYLGVGAILLIGTVLTVAISYVNFGSMAANVRVALLIATVKASLVALIFMHLRQEKKSIYQFLLFTVIFATGLLGLSILAFKDHIHL